MTHSHLPEQMLHGVFLNIFNHGVLLTGPSGAGKSDCALQLLDKKHQLIADDMVIFQKQASNQIIGKCPPALQDLLEIRGLGVVNVKSLFGTKAILAQQSLDLMIDIGPEMTTENTFARHVFPQLEKKMILGNAVLHLTLSLAFTGNMAILIESAVKFAFNQQAKTFNHILNKVI